MTPAKEYIITEDELVEVFAFLENPPMYDVPEFTLEIEQRVRSRPAKESSDNVLDELEKVIISGLYELPPHTIPEVRQAKIDTCEWVLEKMKELRTKDREG